MELPQQLQGGHLAGGVRWTGEEDDWQETDYDYEDSLGPWISEWYNTDGYDDETFPEETDWTEAAWLGQRCLCGDRRELGSRRVTHVIVIVVSRLSSTHVKQYKVHEFPIETAAAFPSQTAGALPLPSTVQSSPDPLPGRQQLP